MGFETGIAIKGVVFLGTPLVVGVIGSPTFGFMGRGPRGPMGTCVGLGTGVAIKGLAFLFILF